MLERLLQLPMFPGLIILFQLIEQIPLDKILNIFYTSNSTDSIPNIDQYPNKLELILNQLCEYILNLFIRLVDSYRLGALLLVFTHDITIVRDDRLQEPMINFIVIWYSLSVTYVL